MVYAFTGGSDMKAVRVLLRQLHDEREKYWKEHREDWDRQEERECSLCGDKKSGYPFVWWHFPATEQIRSIKGIGEIPGLVCPDCYDSFRVQTALWKRSSEEVLLQLLRKCNWRMFLDQLARTGYQTYAPIGDDEGRWASVIQLYARDRLPGEQSPASTFDPIPTYLISIPDMQSDPSEFEMININDILAGHTFAHVVRGQDELREFLHLGPEKWHAQKDEGLLTVEQAAECLQVRAATAYEYCRNFRVSGQYGAMSQPLDDGQGEQEPPPKKRTSIRKLFNYRTAQGEILVSPWAIELFRMQYEKEQETHALSTNRNDVRILFGDQEPYSAWRGDKGEERITWLPRFEFQSAEGGRRARWSRVLIGIIEIPRHSAPAREFSREYLVEHPCPVEEVWLIEDIKQSGGPVMYDLSPDEYWTFRSRMEYERLLYQEEDDDGRDGMSQHGSSEENRIGR